MKITIAVQGIWARQTTVRVDRTLDKILTCFVHCKSLGHWHYNVWYDNSWWNAQRNLIGIVEVFFRCQTAIVAHARWINPVHREYLEMTRIVNSPSPPMFGDVAKSLYCLLFNCCNGFTLFPNGYKFCTKALAIAVVWCSLWELFHDFQGPTLLLGNSHEPLIRL